MTKTNKAPPIVLVAEDEPLVRLDITLALSDAGFAVIETRSADDALEVLEARHVDVIFTDIEMPGRLDGLRLAEIVAERWPDTAVIATSGRRSVDADSDLVFFPKPYDTGVVISRARALAHAA